MPARDAGLAEKPAPPEPSKEKRRNPTISKRNSVPSAVPAWMCARPRRFRFINNKEREMKQKTVDLTVDGNPLRAEEGATILQAARQYGIHIPTICYLESLSPYGGCRICLVEIGGGNGKTSLDTSCTRQVQEGMVVQTQSPRVVRARK